MLDTQTKQEIRQNYPIRKDLSLNDIELTTDNRIKLPEGNFEISFYAMKNFLKNILGVTPKFVQKFRTIFDRDQDEAVVELKDKVLSKMNGDYGVSLFISPKNLTVTNITSTEKPYLSPEIFFDIVENMLSNHDIEDEGNVDITFSRKGNIIVNAINPDFQFDVEQMPKEVFDAGFTVLTGPSASTSVRPFLRRLECVNGIIFNNNKIKGGLVLDSGRDQDIADFATEAENYNVSDVDFVDDFKGRVNRMDQTTASFRELKRFYDQIRGRIHDVLLEDKEQLDDSESRVITETLETFLPVEGTKQKYAQKGIDLDDLTKSHWKNAKSTITCWELANSITNIASHDHGLPLTEDDKLNLKIQGADYMYKNYYDTEYLLD